MRCTCTSRTRDWDLVRNLFFDKCSTSPLSAPESSSGSSTSSRRVMPRDVPTVRGSSWSCWFWCEVDREKKVELEGIDPPSFRRDRPTRRPPLTHSTAPPHATLPLCLLPLRRFVSRGTVKKKACSRQKKAAKKKKTTTEMFPSFLAFSHLHKMLWQDGGRWWWW